MVTFLLNPYTWTDPQNSALPSCGAAEHRHNHWGGRRPRREPGCLNLRKCKPLGSQLNYLTKDLRTLDTFKMLTAQHNVEAIAWVRSEKRI
jgi:hypothetical protein